MMSLKDLNPNQDAIDDEAAEWVVRLGGQDLNDAERQACTRWRMQSDEHAQAFAFAQSTWENLRSLRDCPDLVLSAGSKDTPSRRINTIVPNIPRVIPRWWGAIAACLLIVGLVGIMQFDNVNTMLSADHRTGVGEIHTVTLPDGSRVELNTDSAIALDFNGEERKVELLEGEAAFTAAPMTDEEPRPFVVHAADGITKALGTQFVIRVNDKGAQVTGIEHHVEVSQGRSSSNDLSSVQLAPGESVRYDADRGLGAIEQENIERLTAWRHGHLIFDDMPLTDAIDEINRYQSGWIIIGNDELAQQRVSGVFRVDDIEGALKTIATELHASTLSIGFMATLLF